MRKKLMMGNWKMNTCLKEAVELASGIKRLLKEDVFEKVSVAICPPFVYLLDVKDVLEGSDIKLGAQDAFYEASGAFTGGISPGMLRDVGCDYAIIGHSERRHIMGETDEIINKKLRACMKEGLTPVLCVGELLNQRESGQTDSVITGQVRNGLKGFTADDVRRMVVAYEPVWAIGTGKTATQAQAQEVHKLIRGLITGIAGPAVSGEMLILYGGSVKPENIKELMSAPDIDGALVGGASLKADSFEKIVKYY